MKKILVIGQAPPAQKQLVPYDSTLFYVMLSWMTPPIIKSKAQDLFDFDALVDYFPGFDHNGAHRLPDREAVYHKIKTSLGDKIIAADKVILLGIQAKQYLCPSCIHIGIEGKYLILPHPSTRNMMRIMDNQHMITHYLNQFIHGTEVQRTMR